MGLSRWERRAERRADEARRQAPTGFDMERLPWGLFAGLGVVFMVLGIDGLNDAGSAFQWVAAVGMLVLVGPAQFLTAYRLHRGIPLTTP